MTKSVPSILIASKGKIDNIPPFYISIVLYAIFLLLPLTTYNHTTMKGDLAEYLNNPLRVINGELPYRDFWLLFPPGEALLPALIYKMFGLNINKLLIFSLIISSFIGIFSFFLGKLILRDNFFSIMTAMLVYFNGITARYAGYTYIHIYFLLLIISALFFIRHLKNDNAIEIFLAGIFIGLAFLFRFYEVIAAFLAILITILIYSILERKTLSRTFLFKSLAIYCGGVLLVIGLAYLVLFEIWQFMVKEVVFESLSHGTSMNLPYFNFIVMYLRLFTNLKMVSQSGYSINVILCYLLPFLLGGISIRYLIGKELNKFDKIIVLFLLFWGVFTFPKALGRSDIAHLAYSITPLFFLLIFLLQKSLNIFKESKTSLNEVIASGFVIVSLLLSVLPILWFLVDTGDALITPHYEVSTRYGTLLLENESDAKDINAVINYINKNTSERDYIFITPWFSPPFYALTNRNNPTYYDSLIDLIARPSDEKQKKVCNDIIEKETKLIIHYPDWGFDNKKELQFSNTCPILQKCIEDNFKLVESYGHYWIYVPRNKQISR